MTMLTNRPAPLSTLAARRKFNSAMRAKGIPAKVCGCCLVVRGHAAFSVDRKAPDGHRGRCRACDVETKAAYHAERRDDPEYRASNAARSARWRAENLDKARAKSARWRAENPDKERASSARWTRENPDKARAKSARYRARKVAATVEDFSAEDLLDYWDAIGAYDCVFCGADAEHVEHFIPLARGGAHSLANQFPACARCNLAKGAADPYRWVADRFPGLRSKLEPYFDTIE
ncbi:HNH endonuclease [Streptomyces olivaceus]|uniref:HNH endonuclease n=1 Tax=Streptomyces olivaceus TaxID=47716 RepID=A0ABS7W0H0_STROV|nr:HNH endonuclease [Streptomyces olivaceus]MBZ6088975.1 HNH endonuclease [Streptomyces olivaceus]MBZ6095651.1 HNH endonuclease [Streptomyces olivaceus]MBZ6119920.1 HNH endonuclease [Streptomyces olivaceus]MBZ6151471.1 HNH endonuclease [Streptomyces olivaceus]MBZ6298407.1 HNH endonuclease [Streptomyces olivaceus]